MQSNLEIAERSSSMRLVVSAPGLVPRSLRLPEAQPETVLVVLEDERERGWLAATLRHHGFQVLAARHAGHALLTMFRSTQAIDVLVTDAQLSDMSGSELSDRIRSHCPDLDAVLVSRPLRSEAVVAKIKDRFLTAQQSVCHGRQSIAELCRPDRPVECRVPQSCAAPALGCTPQR